MIPRVDRPADYEIVGYLERWYLMPRVHHGPHLYLHHFIAPDERVFHDHPWGFQSTILHGGYVERIQTSDGVEYDTRRIVGETFVKNAHDRHYIKSVQPDTWTLILTKEYERNWGFWIDWNSFVPHQDYQVGPNVEIIERVPRNDVE